MLPVSSICFSPLYSVLAGRTERVKVLFDVSPRLCGLRGPDPLMYHVNSSHGYKYGSWDFKERPSETHNSSSWGIAFLVNVVCSAVNGMSCTDRGAHRYSSGPIFHAYSPFSWYIGSLCQLMLP